MIRGLRVRYRGGVEALSGISIELPDRGVVCVVGPNASGKTTLLRALAGLIDYEGEILYDGNDARALGRRALSKLLALVRAEELAGASGVTVLDLLLTSRYPVSRGFFLETEEDLEAARLAARSVGIAHLLRRRLGELSSGELQRVAIAAALARRPRYLLLDEPDAHLDAGAKSEASALLRRVGGESLVVAATHDTVFAFNTCDHFVVLRRGRMAFWGTKEEAISRPEAFEEAFGISFAVLDVGPSSVLVPVYGVPLLEQKAARASTTAASSETPR
ncbi:MAG: ABC transporter ATP-binding protein [Desulfurococcaceae archaeon]